MNDKYMTPAIEVRPVNADVATAYLMTDDGESAVYNIRALDDGRVAIGSHKFKDQYSAATWIVKQVAKEHGIPVMGKDSPMSGLYARLLPGILE
jgi:hypothetical protein